MINYLIAAKHTKMLAKISKIKKILQENVDENVMISDEDEVDSTMHENAQRMCYSPPSQDLFLSD